MMAPARDQISGLPETILHDILSRLPRRDAAMTRVLSKALRETWYTFPILSISDSQLNKTFCEPEDFIRERDIFIEYVKKTLLRFPDRGLAIKEFKLKMDLFDNDYMSREVDLWYKLACENGVEVLELCISGYLTPSYTVPPQVLQTKSLNKLVLKGSINVGQAFLNCSTQFFSLRVLSLSSVRFEDEKFLEHLITRCPMIEQITLDCCYVYNSLAPVRVLPFCILKLLSMNGLQKLKAVEVHGIQELHIDAPNLENLSYSPHRDISQPFKLNFISCRNLRKLKLSCFNNTTFEDNLFPDLFSKFPFLESLKLINCSLPERINISYGQLKILELNSCSNLKEINIDAPKLLSFRYICQGQLDDKPVISFLRTSSHLEVNVLIYLLCDTLYNLKEFIQNFKVPNVLTSLFLSIDASIEPNPVVVPASSPPPSIKHLVIFLCAIPRREAWFLPIVNMLLSCCFPETISFNLPPILYTRQFLVSLSTTH